MQYQFIAAALVANAIASPAYAPSYDPAPAPPAYEVASSSVVVVKPTAPVYSVVESKSASSSSAVKTATASKSTAVVTITKGASTAIVYPQETKPAQATSIVYVCPSKVYETVYTTLTSVVDNKPTQYVSTIIITKTVQPSAPASTPVAPKPSTPVQQIGDGQVQVPAKTPATYPANPAANGTAPPPYKSGNNGNNSSPAVPQKYTGAASSLSAAGLLAGLGAMAAFFL